MEQAGWTTTTENYLGRVTKAHILEAVREAKGDDTARLIEHLKKADMAKEAERLLSDTGWLPEALVRQTSSSAPDMAAADTPPPEPTGALPAFLTGAAAATGDTATAACE
jgi:ParB family chromosome partitioning protein